MDIDEEATKSWAHFIAGALAGTAEHTGMYPIDTIKTHIQAEKGTIRSGIRQTWNNLIHTGGVASLFRGMSAILVGAAPAHAVFFATWEFTKRTLGAKSHSELRPIESSIAGVVATVLSEAIMTPMDAVKQKRQLDARHYKGTLDCIRKVIRTDGFLSLYAGYTTTLVMNVPYNAVYFPVYEAFRKLLKSDASEHDVVAHLLAGGGAGAVAGALSNPLDVARTRLQTMHDVGIHYRGMVDALRKIWLTEGMLGFTRGMTARMVFHSTSGAMMWCTYEYVKYILGADQYAKRGD